MIVRLARASRRISRPKQSPPDKLIAGLEAHFARLGRKVRFVVRLADGGLEAATDAAAELVRTQPDVIVAWLTPMVVAAKRATDRIPIVMGGAGNPVENGLVERLARPGGNVTGISGQGAELAGKCVEIVRECLPSTARRGVLANVSDPFTATMLQA
jgi:putative ABC transport system substrate-binding protein